MAFWLPQLVWLFAALTPLGSGVSGSAQGPTSIHFRDLSGKWVLASIYRTSNVQGPSNSEAKRLLGTSIVFRANKMSSCGVNVPIARIVERKLSQEDLLQDARVRFSELG